MAEDVPPLPDRTLTALGERVAVVETKVGGVQDDLRRIGNHIHTISGAVTEISYLEKECAKSLTAITDTVARFESRLETLIEDRAARRGVADFGKRFQMIVTAGAALAGILTGAGALLIWLAHALRGA